MTYRWRAYACGLAAAVLIALASYGCGKKGSSGILVPNRRPTVSVTAAPISRADTTKFNFVIDWSGYDEDGRVDHFIYAIDPTLTDTLWNSTTKNELNSIQKTADGTDSCLFLATQPRFPNPNRPLDPVRGVDFHTFVIKAVDDRGLASEPSIRQFFAYTVAPTVTILSPRPSATSTAAVTPATRITWSGVDPDGVGRQKPVKYRYKLLPKSNAEFDITFAITQAGPDSLRRFYAATNFAGWDSVGGDTTTVQYTGLTPNQTYLFIVIGIDEAGAYNADFSTSSNMLTFQVGYAGTLGPKITLFNEFYFYSMPTGGFAPNNPAGWQTLEVPSGTRLTFNWFATAPQGADMEWYRWRVGGNVEDEDPRTNETTDWSHWSQKSLSTTSCTIGPFNTPEERTLYIEAQDNNTMLSILVVKLKPIIPSMNTPTGHELLIVDDTRLEVDQFTRLLPNGQGDPAFRKSYGQGYPARSELDTLLYARGGYPWRAAALNTPGATSVPGVFAGYTYDTLGTRLGFFNAAVGVPFSLLSQYRHIIWMVDHNGGYYIASATNSLQPMSTLHYMCTPGHNNTFSTYTYTGGKMWLLGGAGSAASMREFNAIGADNNDRDYAPINGLVFAGAGYAHHTGKEELQPGRLMYDGAKWQSLTISQVLSGRVIRSTTVSDTADMNHRWQHKDGTTADGQPGYQFANHISPPDYSLLPARMNLHTNPATDPVNGEPVPPTRNQSTFASSWWTTSLSVDLEYLLKDNIIIEDMNPDPVSEDLRVALDTLMTAQGSGLVAGGIGYHPATMTWYHGVASQEFIFTGFPIWVWRRADCQTLVDFVMQQVWHLSNGHAPALAGSRQYAIPAGRQAPAVAPATARFHMPGWRSGGK